MAWLQKVSNPAMIGNPEEKALEGHIITLLLIIIISALIPVAFRAF